jgi:ADP-ribose pyrophosphatase YjhB (NUDIX family)
VKSLAYRFEDRWDDKIIVLTAVIIKQDLSSKSRILLIREGESPYEGEWVLPQGQPKTGESLVQSAVRECMEEVNLNVDLESLLGAYDDFQEEESGTRHIMIMCYIGTIAHGETAPSNEAADYAWVDPNQPPSSCPNIVKKMLSDYCSKKA